MQPQFSDEELAAILGMGQDGASMDPDIQRLQAQIASLRANSKAPSMRDNGRVVTAPNPLEYMGALANQYVGNKDAGTVSNMQKQQIGLQGAQAQKVLAMLLRQRQQQQMQGQQPAMTDPNAGDNMPMPNAAAIPMST